MEDFSKGKVRIYQRNIKRKLKDGTSKTYKTESFQVIMGKSDLFTDNQDVIILLESYQSFNQELLNDLQESNRTLQERNKTLQEQQDSKINQLDRLRNRFDHINERFIKSQDELSIYKQVINDLTNRSFFDYIRGRLPESYKELQAPKEDIKKS
jgi:predicted nuclease with TOPRIM domain